MGNVGAGVLVEGHWEGGDMGGTMGPRGKVLACPKAGTPSFLSSRRAALPALQQSLPTRLFISEEFPGMSDKPFFSARLIYKENLRKHKKVRTSTDVNINNLHGNGTIIVPLAGNER